MPATHKNKAVKIRTRPASNRYTVPGNVASVALQTILKVGEATSGRTDSMQAKTANTWP